MDDPFPVPPPPALTAVVAPLASALSLHTLPLHAHELALAAALYAVVQRVVSPAVSRRLFPATYCTLAPRQRLNWDVHVVSLVQSCIVCVLAAMVFWCDRATRANMAWPARVWAYSGAGGLVQAVAAGYFLWDLVVTAANVAVFGWGMVGHAVCALFVYALGFRPFVNYYGPTFVLYELSSPFLNVHWFCDKLDMTGSPLQFYNGVVLLATFFGFRLVWGSYQSVRIFADIWRALHHRDVASSLAAVKPSAATTSPSGADMMRFAAKVDVPAWLALVYLAANLFLNSLNWYWFSLMIQTIRKRFAPPFGTRDLHSDPAAAPLPSPSSPAGRRSTAQDASDAGTDADAARRAAGHRKTTSLLVEGTEVDTVADAMADAVAAMTTTTAATTTSIEAVRVQTTDAGGRAAVAVEEALRTARRRGQPKA